jgi:hypothetical protein
MAKSGECRLEESETFFSEDFKFGRKIIYSVCFYLNFLSQIAGSNNQSHSKAFHPLNLQVIIWVKLEAGRGRHGINIPNRRQCKGHLKGGGY